MHLLYKRYSLLLIITNIIIFISNSVPCEETNSSPSEKEDYVWETVSLITNGGFEPTETKDSTDSILSGWKYSPEDANTKIQLDNETYLSGKNALRIDGKGTINIHTGPIPIPNNIVSITGSISYHGNFPSKAIIQWMKGEEQLTTTEFKLIETPNSDWKRFVLPETQPPSESNALYLQLSSDLNPTGTVWWDEVVLTAIVEQTQSVEIFVNQVGYDLLCPKSFIVATNFVPDDMEAYILDSSENQLQKISLSNPSRIIGAYKSDWGKWFYRGDFTDFNDEGTYKIGVFVKNKKYLSPSFMIGKDLLWEKTIPIVLEGIRIHRCGIDVEGIHEPCHTDDSWEGKSLIGGWHNGEDYGKQKTALCLNYLAESYNICKWRLLKNPELEKLFREELEWGSKYIINRIQEDGSLLGNIISKQKKEEDNLTIQEERVVEPPQDEEICVSALSYISYGLASNSNNNIYIEKTERIANSMLNRGIKIPGLFTALIYLSELKGPDKYLPQIQAQIPSDLLSVSEAIPRYDTFTYESKTYELIQALKNTLQPYIEQANQNPFGICPIKWSPEVDFFGITTPKEQVLKGTNLYLLHISQLAGKAFRFMPDESTKKLFFDQINWILGVNPFGVCFIQGIGEKNLPSISHPYVKAGVAPSKLVGIIPYGIRASSRNQDTPYLDMSNTKDVDPNSTSVSLEAMALYINALAHYYRVHIHSEMNLPVPSNTTLQ